MGDYDKNRTLVHVSGHGSQEELKLMLAMTRPSYFMPVHGEAVHLRAHAELARKVGIPNDHIFILDNGDSLEMRSGQVKRGPSVESGVVYVDGLRIGDTDPIVLRDRQKLANDGMVTVVAIVSLKRKRIAAPLRHVPVLIHMRGGPGVRDGQLTGEERQRDQRRAGERGD